VQPTQEPQGSSDPSGDQLDLGPDSTEELELSPEWQASAMAVATGEPVEIVSQRTETTQAWAMPDGTFEAKVHVAPERFLRNGEWVDVDLTVVTQPDGSLAPVAHPDRLVLSGAQSTAGDHDLVSMAVGEGQFALGWRGPLPGPYVSDTTVVWPRVRPGVDLAVTVLPTGFEQSLWVHDRAGLEHASSITYPLRSEGLQIESDGTGGLLIKGALGEELMYVPPGRMWDAQVDQVSQEHLREAPVMLELREDENGAQELVTVLDPEFLADPNLQFPVVIDPTISKGPAFDAFVQTGWTSDQSGANELKLGTYDGGSHKARSFLSFHKMDFLHGATVTEATLGLWEWWSWSCRSARWEAWRTSYVNRTARWTNQPTWIERVGLSDQTRGYNSSCSDGWVYIPADGAFRHITGDASSTTVNIGLRAAKESDSDGWKRFRSSEAATKRPYAYIKYTANRAPAKPTAVKVYEFCEGSCSSGVVVRDRGAGVQAKITDPEGHDIRAYFEVWQGDTRVYNSSVVIKSGEIALRRPWLDDGGSYRMRVRGRDSWGLYGPWSDWFYFSIDKSGPSVPTDVRLVSCYPAGGCASPAMVNDARPTFRATPRHPYDDDTDLVFEVHPAGQTSVLASGTVANAPADVQQTWRPPSALPDGSYRLRVRSIDDEYGRDGSWSSWYSFTIDTSPPATPTVSSNLYLHKDAGTWNGRAGWPGAFTFGPAGSTDVTAYQWRWLGGDWNTVTVNAGQTHTASLAPPGDHLQELEVRSVDRAGNTSPSRGYPFLVRPQATDVAYWKFDEGSGDKAIPTTGDAAYTGTLVGGSSWVASGINPDDPTVSGTAVSLDGLTGYVEVPPALATDHAAGFTITAWVLPTVLSQGRTVAALLGQHSDAARLYYDATSARWCFAVRSEDSASGVDTAACAAGSSPAGEWTHLAGVYDRAAGKIRIWVNGGPNSGEFPPGAVAEADAPDIWAAKGAFRIGRARDGGFWSGKVDEVRVHQRVLNEFELQHVFLQCRYATCPPVPEPTDPVLIGQWDLNEGSGTVAADSSGLGNHASFYGGAAWTADGYGGTPGMRYGGAPGELETSDTVVLSDQSFTVTAWVRLEELTAHSQYVVQETGVDTHSAFALSYDSSGKWSFRTRSQDGTWYVVKSAALAKAGVWTHVAGVFDAEAGELRIYVNGVLDGVKTEAAGGPATSPLRIGWMGAANLFTGTIDAVRAYQTALTSQQVSDLYNAQRIG